MPTRDTVITLDPNDDPKLVGRDLQQAVQCLTQLGRVEEIDAFREAVIAVHKDNWRLLQAAAMSYVSDAVHFGFIVAGEFHRGQHPGGGQYAGSFEHDRVVGCSSCFRVWIEHARTPIGQQRAATS